MPSRNSLNARHDLSCFHSPSAPSTLELETRISKAGHLLPRRLVLSSHPMSQHYNTIAGPSQSHSDASSVHYHRCWWAWCHSSFYTKRDLLDHISFEHVQKAQPERLRDIPAHKKTVDEYWDTMDILSLPSFPFVACRDGEVTSQKGSEGMLHPTKRNPLS